MIISQDSPFRNVPANITIEQVVVFDAIRYSIDISEISFERLVENLFMISYSSNKDKTFFPLIFSDIWSIISNLTIFFNVVTKHFSIEETDPIFDKIRVLKLMRHSNQHIEDRIKLNENPNQFPIYGKLSWYAQESYDSNKGVIVSLYPGSVKQKSEVKPSIHNPSGEKNDKLINGIEFTAMIRLKGDIVEKTINLHEVIINISEIINHFENQLKLQLSKHSEKEKQVSDIILKLFVERRSIKLTK